MPETNPLQALAASIAALRKSPLVKIVGRAVEVTPTFARISGLSPFLCVGDCVQVETASGPQLAEVVRVDQQSATVKPFDSTMRAGVGALARLEPAISISPHVLWRGRVVDALCRPIDMIGPLTSGHVPRPFDGLPPAPLQRASATVGMRTGVRAIDAFTPICAGQRLGIFAGSGVGKSTLLGMMARAASFDTAVIALVGERGREVQDFIRTDLGERAANAVVVVSTGDESPMMRRLAPKAALTIAEFFRDQGQDVLLIIDSMTRFAHASRDVALSAGELPVSRGYPPSVFSELPRLMERAGPGARDGGGSITAIVSVLVDGDDHNDPVADSLRGILDGHIVLSRAIAEQGRFPAIDILRSLSRLAKNVYTSDHAQLVSRWRSMAAVFEDTRDLRLIGGYKPGLDPVCDEAVIKVPRLYAALNQKPGDVMSLNAIAELAACLSE